MRSVGIVTKDLTFFVRTAKTPSNDQSDLQESSRDAKPHCRVCASNKVLKRSTHPHV